MVCLELCQRTLKYMNIGKQIKQEYLKILL